MRRLLPVLLLLSACLTAPGRRWSALDVGGEVLFAAETAVDWRQTADITRDCNELNPIVGKCGQRVAPWAYMPSVILLHLLASALLPHGSLRTAWQGLTDGVEGHTVYLNWRGGYWPGPK